MANKEKKIKTRDSGFNIAYRVVTALTAAATFPVMFFTSLFYFAYTIPYFSLISGDASDTGASYLTMSIYEVLSDSPTFNELFTGKDAKVDLAGVIAEVKPQLVAIACLYAAVALLALLIIVFASFTRKKLPIVITSLLGVGVLSFIPLAFSKLTAPFTDGTINLDSFLHTGLESIMDLVAKVDFIRAGDAYTYLWVIFAGIVIWTGAVMLVNMGDEPKKNKQPKEKKAE